MTIKIDYKAQGDKFVIRAEMWENDIVRKMPSRRFEAKSKLWTAPAVRRNVEYLKSEAKDAIWSESARDRVRRSDDMARIRQGASAKFPEGHQFKTTPRPYQMAALDACYPLSAFALFAEMRTGKSKIVIDLANRWYSEGRIDRVVVLCPPSVMLSWRENLAAHDALRHDLHEYDPSKYAKTSVWYTNGLTEGAIPWLVAPVTCLAASERSVAVFADYINRGKTLVVVDESIKIKNPTATTTKNAVYLARLSGSTVRGILNGTPNSKGFEDFYSQFEFLDPDIIGIADYFSFRNRYCVMGGFENKQIVAYQNVNELFDLIKPYTFQIKKSEALPHLPPKQRMVRTYKPLPEQVSMIKELKLTKEAIIGEARIEIKNALGLAIKAQQILSGFVYHVAGVDEMGKKIMSVEVISEKPPKIAALLEAIEQVSGKVVIWSRFQPETKTIIKALNERFPNEGVVYLQPGTDQESTIARNYAIQSFRQDARFMLGNPAVGGMGLDFSCADTAIYYTSPVAYVDRSQSEDRIHYGDNHQVLIVDLVGEGTVEELIYEANVRHMDLLDFIRGKLPAQTVG